MGMPQTQSSFSPTPGDFSAVNATADTRTKADILSTILPQSSGAAANISQLISVEDAKQKAQGAIFSTQSKAVAQKQQDAGDEQLRQEGIAARAQGEDAQK